MRCCLLILIIWRVYLLPIAMQPRPPVPEVYVEPDIVARIA